jgi:hypothetical protein
MRTFFQEFYRPSEDEFKKLWENCVFSLDANVLLNVYRYSEATSKQLLDLLDQISSRIWMPHSRTMAWQGLVSPENRSRKFSFKYFNS